MDDVKKTYREGEQAAKETWRKSDGDESLADKVGNAGDEMPATTSDGSSASAEGDLSRRH